MNFTTSSSNPQKPSNNPITRIKTSLQNNNDQQKVIQLDKSFEEAPQNQSIRNQLSSSKNQQDFSFYTEKKFADDQLQRENSVLKFQIKTLEDKLDVQLNDNRSLKLVIDKLEKKLESQNQEMFYQQQQNLQLKNNQDSIQQDQQDLRNNLSDKTQQIRILQSNLDQLEQQYYLSQKQVDQEQQKISIQNHQIERMERYLQEQALNFSEREDNLQLKIRNHQQQYEELQILSGQQIQRSEDDIRSYKKEIERLNKIIEEQQQDKMKDDEDFKDLEIKKLNLEKNYLNCQQVLQQKETDLKFLVKEFKICQEQLQTSYDDQDQLNIKLDLSDKKCENQRQELEANHQTNSNQTHKINGLERELQQTNALVLELKQRLENQHLRNNTLEQQLEQKEVQLNSSINEIQSLMQKERQNNDKISLLVEETEKKTYTIQEKILDIKNLNEKNSFIQSQLSKVEENYRQSSQTILQINQDRENLKKIIIQHEADIDSLSFRIKELDRTEIVIADTNKKMNFVMKENENLKTIHEQMKVEAENLKQKCAHVELYSENMKQSLEKWKFEYNQVSAQLGDAIQYRQQIQELQTQKDLNLKEIERLKENLIQKANDLSGFKLKENDYSFDQN